MNTQLAPPLIVLIVAYRADEHLAGCLTELGDSYEVVVVDNDAPNSGARKITTIAGCHYLPAPSNLGFAGAVNLGLRASWDGQADVLLLNPDARIDAKGVGELQRALRSPDMRRAAVGPRLSDQDGTIQRADWPMPSPAQVWSDAVGAGRLWWGRRFITGAVLLLRSDALSDVGVFDERYFLYAEESDWQLRAQRAGWSVGVVDGVTAMHAGGASSSDPALRDALFHASYETFARRWYGQTGWVIMRLGSLVAAARRTVMGPPEDREHNRRAIRLYLRGPIKVAQQTRQTA